MKKLKALRQFLESYLIIGIQQDDFLVIIDNEYLDQLGINPERDLTDEEQAFGLNSGDWELVRLYVTMLNRIMIAKEFSKLVLEHTRIDELNAVLEQGVELDGGFDMITAFESVMECSWSEEFAELTNTAWDLAIKMKFYINE